MKWKGIAICKTSHQFSRTRHFSIFLAAVLLVSCLGLLLTYHPWFVERKFNTLDETEFESAIVTLSDSKFDSSVSSGEEQYTKNLSSSILYLDSTGYLLADDQSNYASLQNAANGTYGKTHEVKHELKNSTLPLPYKDSHYNSIEHDPTIDENAVPETYKFYLNGKQRSMQCTMDDPVQYIVFLRSHRTGGHTLCNIFYRYGDYNNLFFALPNAPAFQYYWPLRFHHSYISKSLLNKTPPNFMINIARNDINRIKAFAASETFNIAVVRNPILHFQSVYEYIDMPYFMKMISKESHLFSEFVKDPQKNIDIIINKTKRFDPVFHLLKNGQLFDLGYETRDYDTPLKLEFIIGELEDQLDLVLLSDYMDESLVLLQRLLCWQLSDMLYLRQRVRKRREPISAKDKEAIALWNEEDTELYNYFNRTFWKRINEQDESFWQDVNKLKDMIRNIEKECVKPKENMANMDIQSGHGLSVGARSQEIKSNRENSTQRIKTQSSHASNSSYYPAQNTFEFKHTLREDMKENMKYLCERLLLSEKDYIKLLKLKQKHTINEVNNVLTSQKYTYNATEGNFYYVISSNKTDIFNTTEHAQINNDESEVEEEIIEPTEIVLGIGSV